jgi:cytosine/adenosine deaminase-related metal-dependent hydrolase
MTDAPTWIRNASWAVLWDASSGRHFYRLNVDLSLADGRIAAVEAAGTTPPSPGERAIDGRGHLVLPGLINLHSHPTTEPAYRGVREDHGVREHQMTGLFERLQAFRLDDAGRRAAATLAYSEMLSCGTTTAMDLTGPFDGWFDIMAASGMRWYVAPAFASARWGMSAPQTVTGSGTRQADAAASRRRRR